jgi:hypothetical protein
MNNTVNNLNAMLLRKVLALFIFSNFLFFSCQKDKEVTAALKPTEFPSHEKGIFKSLAWQKRNTLLTNIQLPSGLNISGFRLF